MIHVEAPRFARRRGSRDLRTGERLSRYFVMLRVRPKGQDPFDVDGVLLADMEISIGSKLRVHYDPRRPSRWTLAPRPIFNSIPRRPAEPGTASAPAAVASAYEPHPVPATPDVEPVGVPITVDLTDSDAVWADHDRPQLTSSSLRPLEADVPMAPVTIAPMTLDPVAVAAEAVAPREVPDLVPTMVTTLSPRAEPDPGAEPQLLPIGDLPPDLADVLSDSMTARFQALTLGGGFPSPADIAAMAETLAAQADRRQASGRHRPSSHRPTPAPERDLATQLTDLSRLHLAGSLSDREFAMAKAQLLEP